MSNLQKFFQSSKAVQTNSRVHHPVSVAGNYLAGHYRSNAKIHNLVPAYFIFQLGAIGLTAFAARTSYSRYFDITQSQIIASIGTVSVAVIIYFAASYVAGILAEYFTSKETKQKTDLVSRSWLQVAAIIALIVAGTLATWDYKMNVAGASDIGNSFVNKNHSVNFTSINSAHDDKLHEIQNRIKTLTSGALGSGFGWWSGKINKSDFLLNKSGKKYLSELESKESQYLALKELELKTNVNQVDAVNKALTTRRTFAQSTFVAVAKFVYAVQFLVCIAASIFSQLISHFIDSKTMSVATVNSQSDATINSQSDDMREPVAKNKSIDKHDSVSFDLSNKSHLFTSKDAKTGRKIQASKKNKRASKAKQMRESGYAVNEIARRLQVSTSTIQRDLNQV